MGKYIRKPKTTGDVAVRDVSQSSLGVRTRAKTLALKRLQSSSPSVDASSPQPPKREYLELRSRRLEKPPLIRQQLQNSRKSLAAKQGFVCGDKEGPQVESSPQKPCSGSGVPVGEAKEGDGCYERQSGGFEIGDTEIEASLGENYLDLEARERSTRESTPCSLIRTADTIPTPGSSTKRRSPTVANERVQNALLRSIPTAHEMEEFFTRAEQPQQRHFIEKYNFDIVNDLPLPGRYEWVRVTP
ncbi:UNVERIFIED_CONTAM: Cyclin-dependent kinase inhibitor 3 [Sesamum latifolium]|uniref:Cyclin-dependent kinase inhibitor 3 n=1 Tax=Sesamum latifolium TaxID=2727402 RepID=A0AAW2XZK8_9LAMI